MRIPHITAALLLALPVSANDLPDGYEKIGTFRGEYRGKPLVLVSTSNAGIEYSDLNFTTHADENQRVSKTYTVQSSAGLARLWATFPARNVPTRNVIV